MLPVFNKKSVEVGRQDGKGTRKNRRLVRALVFELIDSRRENSILPYR